MGIYAQAAICILSGRPYDSHWEAIFKDLDNVSLFRLSLGSPEMFKVVMTYVRLNQPNSSSVDEVRVGGPQDLLSRIPTDILAEIMQYLPLSSRRKLAKASRKFAALGARELQAGVTRLLSAFGLYHSEVRFMQTATGAILSGRVIPYLVDYTHAVDSLDFYAPDYSYRWVMTFFELATKKKPKYGYQSLLRGVRGSASFLRSDAKDCQNSHWIRVLQSQTDSALDCITYLPFSHLFGAVTAYGAWFGYPDTSAEGETFPNRACMDLGTMLADSEVRAVVDEWIDRYRFSVGSLAWHTCGTDFECPATPRATDDAGLHRDEVVILLGLVQQPRWCAAEERSL
ncbi:hypothetical protein C8F04DRAFT_1278198 [Mycena alexandri]|uniref:F-box domain-containing protein n=1 Tax=Mycena alexandri TaxID=1745969 RepID=A0AAD6RZB7_9AGAR|nr:hypothetical protein C8F04DRAFT_1278198 [Mycena alexandri]